MRTWTGKGGKGWSVQCTSSKMRCVLKHIKFKSADFSTLWSLNGRCGPYVDEDSGQRLQGVPASSKYWENDKSKTNVSNDDSPLGDDIIWWGCHKSSSCVPIVTFDPIVPLSYRRHHRPQIVVVIESIIMLFPLPLVCMVFILRLRKRLSLGRELPSSLHFLLFESPPLPLFLDFSSSSSSFWEAFFLSPQSSSFLEAWSQSENLSRKDFPYGYLILFINILLAA